MNRKLCILFALAVAAPAFALKPKTLPQTFRAGQVLVKFAGPADSAEADAVRRQFGFFVRGTLPDGRTQLLGLPGTLDVGGAIGVLKGRSEVSYAEPNYLRYPRSVTPNDTLFNAQWGLDNTGQADFSTGVAGTLGADLNMTNAWDLNGDGVADHTGLGNTIVAVVDSGMLTTHPDLAANFIVGASFSDSGTGTNVLPSSSTDTHGTEVAGTIGAVGNNALGVTGTAWTVKMMPLKFAGDVYSEVNALAYAAANGAKVANTSFGGPNYSLVEEEQIAALGTADILVVASAGNESSNTDFAGAQYPANYQLENILSVSATNRQDDVVGFSTFGPVSVDLAAPGYQIVTTTLNNGYTTSGVSGSSFAAGYVSGIAALIGDYSGDPVMLDAKPRLIESANPGKDSGSPVAGQVVGGRVDAAAALRQLPKPSLNILPYAYSSYPGLDINATIISIPVYEPVSHGDGVISMLVPGSTVTLGVDLQNDWSSVKNVVGTLTASNGVTVTSGPVAFGDLVIGQSITRDFTVSVPGGSTGHQFVTFTLSLVGDGGYTATRHFIQEIASLSANTPVTQLIGISPKDYYHTWLYQLTAPLPSGQTVLTFQTTAANDIDILVGYSAPVQYDIDLLINDQPGADTSNSVYWYNVPDTQTGAAPGGNEYVNIVNPPLGNYYITVIDYDETVNASYTLEALTGSTLVGGFPSSTIAYEASNVQIDNGGALPPAAIGGLALAAWLRRRGRARRLA